MKSVIEMAREAGLGQERWNTEEQLHSFLERFAALVREDEREACAKVCDQRISSMFSEMFDKGWNTAAKYCAADIRSRSSEH